MRNKIPVTAMPVFSCQDSLDWIKQYTIQYFKEQKIPSEAMWFIDDSQQCFSCDFPTNVCVDIIFTGSFFLRLLELPYWPVQRFRLWTYSEDMRTLIASILKIDKERIGFLPHPESPCTSEPSQELKHFIYAGRLSWGKNIEALLALTSYLQNTTHPHLKLTLWGKNSDFPEESLGRISGPDFDIINIIKKFSWTNPPQLAGYDKGWTDKLNKESHYISLSTSMYEDFAVSPSQAMSKTPAILSGWCGHKHKNGAWLVPSHLIFLSHEPHWVKETKTKLLAKYLVEKKCSQTTVRNFHPSEIFLIDELSLGISRFVKKQTPEILLCFREAVDVYADTTKGRNFFFKYRQIFSMPHQFLTIHLFNDLRGEAPFDENSLLINEADLFLPEVQRLLLSAPRIIISADATQSISYLRKTLVLNSEITLI